MGVYRNFIVLWTVALSLMVCVVCNNNTEDNDSLITNKKTLSECNLPTELKTEIASYSSTVEKIINAAVNGSFKGVTYRELSLFVDTFGSRIAGSQNLENAIDYMINKSITDGLENVHGEDVQVPHWIRYEKKVL